MRSAAGCWPATAARVGLGPGLAQLAMDDGQALRVNLGRALMKDRRQRAWLVMRCVTGSGRTWLAVTETPKQKFSTP